MLSKNALTVLDKRYFLKDELGRVIEDGESLFLRVAKALAEPDRLYGATDAEVEAVAMKFFQLTYDLDFLPNSPTLANAGTRTGQLSACFVLPVDDCLSNAAAMPVPGMGSGIFDSIRAQAIIHQTGGGTGFSFSRLRPKHVEGTIIGIVGSTKGGASGPVSFMDVYNGATESIKQGGMRRGANMGILRVDHPDILEFIRHKEDLSKLTNFNISVAVTAKFMAAVKYDTRYALVDPHTGLTVKWLEARKVFKEIAHRAWSTGEPGIVFIDRMNEYCPVPWMGSYEATNPCGEQPLLPYESCNLGSINLERFVVEEPDGKVRIDWARLRDVMPGIVHLMENVIDANKYPLPEITEVSLATRKLGIGVMGFGRMLFKLGVAYGSPESLTIAAQIFSFIDFYSKVESIEFAKKRGSFPARNGNEEEFNMFFRRICEERADAEGVHPACDYAWLADEQEKYGIRHSNTGTVAPTGTLSIIADTSGGCEPVYALAFKRWQADTHMIDTDGVFREAVGRLPGMTPEVLDGIMAHIDASEGSLSRFLDKKRADGVWGSLYDQLAELEGTFVTAHDITPEDHVRVQAAFQRFNDSACSKTINFNESATVDDVEAAYMLAYETGCKGITVYRNNSRKFQPLSVSPKAADAPVAELTSTIPRADAPDDKICSTCGACSPCGDTCLCGKPPEPKTLFEVFAEQEPDPNCTKPAGG